MKFEIDIGKENITYFQNKQEIYDVVGRKLQWHIFVDCKVFPVFVS